MNLSPIGIISTPFEQKFAIPRQSHALSVAQGKIHFDANINVANACRGIESFSHLWLLFYFHENSDRGWRDTVRPPRLGGNERIGVFATRSTFRPNPIGMSLVKNHGVNTHKQLVVSGVDLVNNTPILDIKPYLPYADTAEDALAGFAQDKPNSELIVEISPKAQAQLAQITPRIPEFEPLLFNVLSQDPRPAYKTSVDDKKIYKVQLYDITVSWTVSNGINHVIALTLITI